MAQEVNETVADFLVPGSFVAIPADTNSINTVWFVQTLENSCAGDGVLGDDYNHKIAAWVNSLKAHFFKKENELCSTKVLDHSSNTMYFYSKSILHPYVNLLQSKKGFILKNTDFIDII